MQKMQKKTKKGDVYCMVEENSLLSTILAMESKSVLERYFNCIVIEI